MSKPKASTTTQAQQRQDELSAHMARLARGAISDALKMYHDKLIVPLEIRVRMLERELENRGGKPLKLEEVWREPRDVPFGNTGSLLPTLARGSKDDPEPAHAPPPLLERVAPDEYMGNVAGAFPDPEPTDA